MSDTLHRITSPSGKVHLGFRFKDGSFLTLCRSNNGPFLSDLFKFWKKTKRDVDCKNCLKSPESHSDTASSYKVKNDGSLLFTKKDKDNVTELPSLVFLYNTIDNELSIYFPFEDVFPSLKIFFKYIYSFTDENDLVKFLNFLMEDVYSSIGQNVDEDDLEYSSLFSAWKNTKLFAKSILKNKYYFTEGILKN